MRRTILLFALLLGTFGAGFLTWTLTATPEHLSIVPFTAVERASDGKTGKQLALITTIVRSDGSMVQKTSDGIHVIWNVAEKTEIAVDPVSGSYVVAPLLATRIPSLTNKLADCEAYFAGRSAREVKCTPATLRMAGHPVTKVDIKITAPNPRKYSEAVHAIQKFGWLVMKKGIFDENGELLTVNEVIDLREGEPPAAEFAVPSGLSAKANFVEYHKPISTARS